jgi:hypothetical protein
MQIDRETNTTLANMKGEQTTKPEYNKEQINKRVFREKRIRKRNFMEQSLIGGRDNMNIWRKVRKNVKLDLKLRKKFKHFKNFEKFRKFHKKEKLNKHLFSIPSTPHNTGQYLISNFCQVRQEKLFEYNSEYLAKDIYSNLIESAAIDDLCVTGGSMKGIINSHLFRRDSDDFSTSMSINNTNNTYIPDDDNLTTGNDCSLYNFSSGNAELDWGNRLNEREEYLNESSQTIYYKQKIEEQKRLIEILMHKIKSQNG